MDSFRLEGRIVDADMSHEWADWVDIERSMPWLPTEPYLLMAADLDRTLAALDEHGFKIVRMQMPDGVDVEVALLTELSKKLEFTTVGVGSWAAFADRLWDLLTESWYPPIAVIIEQADSLLARDVHAFVRCVHNLLALTEGVGSSDRDAQRQVEYFFIGKWS